MIQKNHLSHKNKNSFFDDDFDHEFFNPPLISFPYIYPYYPRDPFHSITNQISKAFDSEVFKSIDFSPKINLSEDENNYYIHDDLSRMTKDQVKMELYDDNHVLTISGEREPILDNSDNNYNTDNTKKDNENKRPKQKNSNQEKTEDENNIKKYTKIECSYGKFSRS